MEAIIEIVLVNFYLSAKRDYEGNSASLPYLSNVLKENTAPVRMSTRKTDVATPCEKIAVSTVTGK